MSIVGIKKTREIAKNIPVLKNKIINAKKKGLSVVVHNGKTYKVGKV